MLKRVPLAAILSFVLAVAAAAVTPRFWENFTHEELLGGTLSRVSLHWDGRLSLAPEYDLFFDTEQPFIFSMVRDKSGNLFVGTGHAGKVFKVDPRGNGSVYFEAKELDIFALALDAAGNLYAGTSPDGKVYKITGSGQATEFCDPEEKYIWSLLFDDAGNLYVGTGGRGRILKVDPSGRKSDFFDPEDSNVMCLVRGADGRILAGTSPGGLVLQISPQGKAFALLDAPLEEIRALAVDRFGTTYAVAASARESAAAAPAKAESVTAAGSPTISAIQVLSNLAERARESGASVSAPGGGADSAGSKSTVFAISRAGAYETLYTTKDQFIYDVLIRQDDSILLSTGGKGRILDINPAKQAGVVTDTPEEQATRLVSGGEDIFVAGSNQGRIYRLRAGRASGGYYESKPLDAKTVASWGKIAFRFTAAQGESLQVTTRSGNTDTPDNTWSEWSAPYSPGAQIGSPAARYLQWRAEFKRGGSSPGGPPAYLEDVRIPYLQQNLRPLVTAINILPAGVALQKTPPLAPGTVSVSATASGREGPSPNSPRVRGKDPQPIPPRQIMQPGAQSLTWKASDENDDSLEYSLYFKGAGETDWKLLEKELTDTFYTIDGASLPDGEYTVKIVASDAPSNPYGKFLIGELVAKPFVISNGTPVLEITSHSLDGRRVEVRFSARVPSGRIESGEFSVDGGRWMLLFPSDGVADSQEEVFHFATLELAPGEHLIGVRASDANGNTGTAKLLVKIP